MPELLPPPISANPEAREFLRAWSAPNSAQQLAVDVTWEDPGAWGLFLVDLARHVSKAYAKSEYSVSEEDALHRIKTLFDAEWNVPTDAPEQL